MFIRRDFRDNDYQEFDRLFSSLVKIISAAQATAIIENKPLLILAGECHHQTHSLTTQLILLLAMKARGINNLLVEFSPKNTSELLLGKRSNFRFNAAHSIPFAKYELDLNIIPADLDRTQTMTRRHDHSARESHMRQVCELSIKESGVFIVGSNHLQPLYDELKPSFHILNINLSNYSLLESIAMNSVSNLYHSGLTTFPKTMKRNVDSYHFIKNKEHVLQIKPTLLSGLSKTQVTKLASSWHNKQKPTTQLESAFRC